MSKKGEGSLSWLRDRNRRRVLDVLRISGRTSQADIARATGLSRTTIHTLIGELKEEGMVLEVDGRPAGAGSGRPAAQLVLHTTSRAGPGIDFGHSHVQGAVADLAPNVLAERHPGPDVNPRANEALDFSAEMAAEVLDEAGIDRSRVIGAGIGIPGPVDRERGTAGSATILPGWVGLRIADAMQKRLGLPVDIENDANLGALAELTWGAGRDCTNFAYIKAATGIGAGLVIDGALLRGATGTAGEIGHTTLDERGALCYCGNRGCLETVASGPAITRLVAEGNGEAPSLAEVIERASAGDLRGRRAASDAGRENRGAGPGPRHPIHPPRRVIRG